jgi:hypothetical protein
MTTREGNASLPIPARKRLARLLAGESDKTSQSAMLRLPAAVLELHVDGVGAVPLPVRAPIAKKLVGVSTPAHFGRGEETLLDTSVRDTGEITPDRVNLAGGRWQVNLAESLEALGTRLGIQHPQRLRAELHSMLVYGKGQFFVPHQDSEKHDDMVATLVVMLPSSHAGGELVVSDQGDSKVYTSSTHELTLVAFYPDCRHEVLPVRSGWRVTLTFNLLLDQVPDAELAGSVDQVAALLHEHFTAPVRRPYRTRDSDPPQRLAVLLDHEYSRRGLIASRLKGEDAERAALVRTAAEAAGYESVLAQAEIDETWDADVEDYLDDEDYDVGEVLDANTVLTWWADSDSAGEISLALNDEEVCAPTPSHRLTPYDSEYEGYMGNYGNTVERWYRRAAVLVWPTDAGFGMRAEARPAWVLRAVAVSLEAGELEQARGQARTLVARWGSPGPELLAPALEVARGVNDSGLAAELLAPFHLQLLTVEHAEPLAALHAVYPASWWAALARQWDPRAPAMYGVGRQGDRFPDRRTWVETVLPALCERLHTGGAPWVAEWFAAWLGEWVTGEARHLCAVAHPARRSEALERLGPALAAVLSASEGESARALATRIQDLGDPALPLALAGLRSAGSAVGSSSALRALASNASMQLEAILARSPRSPDDWSITWESPGGADEDRLSEFLTSATERTLAWPMAAPRRQTIHRLIDEAGLPVTHRTIRSGSPYTLLLEKTDDVFLRETAARVGAEMNLLWLSRTLGQSSGRLDS